MVHAVINAGEVVSFWSGIGFDWWINKNNEDGVDKVGTSGGSFDRMKGRTKWWVKQWWKTSWGGLGDTIFKLLFTSASELETMEDKPQDEDWDDGFLLSTRRWEWEPKVTWQVWQIRKGWGWPKQVKWVILGLRPDLTLHCLELVRWVVRMRPDVNKHT